MNASTLLFRCKYTRFFKLHKWNTTNTTHGYLIVCYRIRVLIGNQQNRMSLNKIKFEIRLHAIATGKLFDWTVNVESRIVLFVLGFGNFSTN